MFLRHLHFLKLVFIHGITAFGGPQAHLAMMMKTFVKQTPYVTEEELLEYNAFCQLLPGASSVQTIMLIGYKRGRALLAILSLIVWILPSCAMMLALSFFVKSIDNSTSWQSTFQFIVPMAAGFLVYASIAAVPFSFKNTITGIIALLTAVITFFTFGKPVVIAILIILGGVITNLSRKRIPQIHEKPRKVQWGNIWLFVAVFLLAGLLSEMSRKQNWESRREFNLFEHTYRMGSLVFGGGNVLMPLMYEQYTVRPEAVRKKNPDAIQINGKDMLFGMGIVRAMPGPVFSISSYTGGLALRDKGQPRQIMGGIIGTVGIFLPSALLVLFFFPIWNNLKKFSVVYRSLEGINAAVLGIMFGSTAYIIKDISFFTPGYLGLANVGVLIGTALTLIFTRLPAPVIVLICLALGYFI